MGATDGARTAPATERVPVMPPSTSAEPTFLPGADRQTDNDGHAAHAPTAPQPPADQIWEAVRRYCPWPPVPSAWKVLDPPCLSTMDTLKLDEQLDCDACSWREVLADPLGTRQAVADALDRPECRVPRSSDWPGETRPDLRQACAAEAMLRLGSLQDKCVERLQTDWESVWAGSMAQVDRISDSQEEYYHLVESDHRARAGLYWETYMCRTVPPGAFEWIRTLPMPQGNPTANRYGRPPITQALDLYAAARRVGADIPDRLIERLKRHAKRAERAEKWRHQLLAEPEIDWSL